METISSTPQEIHRWLKELRARFPNRQIGTKDRQRHGLSRSPDGLARLTDEERLASAPLKTSTNYFLPRGMPTGRANAPSAPPPMKHRSHAAGGGWRCIGRQRLYPDWGPPSRASRTSPSAPGSRVEFRNANPVPAELAQQGLVNTAVCLNGKSSGNPGGSDFPTNSTPSRPTGSQPSPA